MSCTTGAVRKLAATRIADWGLTLDESLLAMNDAVHQGFCVNFHGFGPGAEHLARLPRASLEALIALEREYKSRRHRENVESARKRGVSFGRPKKVLPPSFYRQARLFLEGEVSGLKASEACGMPYSTFMWRAKQLRDKRLREAKKAAAKPVEE